MAPRGSCLEQPAAQRNKRDRIRHREHARDAGRGVFAGAMPDQRGGVQAPRLQQHGQGVLDREQRRQRERRSFAAACPPWPRRRGGGNISLRRSSLEPRLNYGKASVHGVAVDRLVFVEFRAPCRRIARHRRGRGNDRGGGSRTALPREHTLRIRGFQQRRRRGRIVTPPETGERSNGLAPGESA